MDWTEWVALLGNVGEFLGSLAVMVTLVILVVQVRASAKAVEESNQLQRAATLDRHSDTIGLWRGQIATSSELSEAWLGGREDAELDAAARMRLNFVWINFVNAQRSNYIRANTVGELGLARQAVLSVAAEAVQSETFRNEWETMRSWNSLASPDYVSEVDQALSELAHSESDLYPIGGQIT